MEHFMALLHVSLNSDLFFFLISFHPCENVKGVHIWHALQNRKQTGSGPKLPDADKLLKL